MRRNIAEIKKYCHFSDFLVYRVSDERKIRNIFQISKVLEVENFWKKKDFDRILQPLGIAENQNEFGKKSSSLTENFRIVGTSWFRFEDEHLS